jgi:glycosyltransferase involved in cell wall biosynthesis
MRLVLFTHPPFLASQSMPRFAHMLAGAYQALGHQVQVWSPSAVLHNALPRGAWSKWLGYVDQYLLFPARIKRLVAAESADTLFVFSDQALGPWVPLVAHRPHVVHCHDLLALRSALGLVPENPTRASGRVYQRYIRRGFGQARHFISVSEKTRADLHTFGEVVPVTSEVVYNGLNHPFRPMAVPEALQVLQSAGLSAPLGGMLLHVGGGSWYKNVPGIAHMYAAYTRRVANPLPLWIIGPPANGAAQAVLSGLPSTAEVSYHRGLSNQALNAAYSLARAHLFPSLEEGFGWPIVEAQASGCPVLTTDAPPMNEIGGPAARYLPRLAHGADAAAWGEQAAGVLLDLLGLDASAREALVQQGLAWVERFNTDHAIDSYLRIYAQVLQHEGVQPGGAVSASAAQDDGHVRPG